MKHDYQGWTETYRFVSGTLSEEQGESNVRCLQQFIVEVGHDADACAVQFEDAEGFKPHRTRQTRPWPSASEYAAEAAAADNHLRQCNPDFKAGAFGKPP